MRRAAPLALAALLALATLVSACAPAGGDEPQGPFWVRVICTIERWLESGDMRIRDEGVDRCSGAARQLRESREQMERAWRDALPPPGDPEDPEDEGRETGKER